MTVASSSSARIRLLERDLSARNPLSLLGDWDGGDGGRAVAATPAGIRRGALRLFRAGRLRVTELCRGSADALDAGNPLIVLFLARALCDQIAFLCVVQKEIAAAVAARGEGEAAFAGALARTSERLAALARDGGHGPDEAELVAATGTLAPSCLGFRDELAAFCGAGHKAAPLATLGDDRVPEHLLEDELGVSEAALAAGIRSLAAIESAAAAVLVRLEGAAAAAEEGQARLVPLGEGGVGDGLTRERAIHFPSARSHLEHVQMIVRYLQRHGIAEKVRLPMGSDDGYFYEIYSDGRTKLWFKTRLDL